MGQFNVYYVLSWDIALVVVHGPRNRQTKVNRQYERHLLISCFAWSMPPCSMDCHGEAHGISHESDTRRAACSAPPENTVSLAEPSECLSFHMCLTRAYHPGWYEASKGRTLTRSPTVLYGPTRGLGLTAGRGALIVMLPTVNSHDFEPITCFTVPTSSADLATRPRWFLIHH